MKKGQMEINETILVLFIFMILLAIGLVGFFKYNQYSTNKLAETDRMNNFFAMVGNVYNMPEIKCSELNKDVECLDAFKLISAKNTKDFGFAKITIQRVYPKVSDVECDINKFKMKKDCGLFTIYDNPNPDFSSRDVIDLPVTLYYPNEDIYYLAHMKVEVYS